MPGKFNWRSRGSRFGLQDSRLGWMLGLLMVALGCVALGWKPAPAAAPIAEPPAAVTAPAPPQPVQPAPPIATVELSSVTGESTPVDDKLSGDPAVEQLLEPFSSAIKAEMSEEIGSVARTVGRGNHIPSLGSLVTDSMVWHLNQTLDQKVDVALANHGGIRLPVLPVGPIVRSDIYQLLPFENRLVVLEFNGQQLAKLYAELGRNGGEPFSGITDLAPQSKTVSPNQFEVGGKALQADSVYRLVTTDFLADIGRKYTLLQAASSRTETPILWRDAMMEYVQAFSPLNADASTSPQDSASKQDSEHSK
ncbi:Endonuclease YhcR precursor [Stieleria bergensis]|uniref:Endonuclease YhcR n=2 Tax=Stieleria bergensis TaxID=2528025 RepID=A0A517SZE4_9BACT|nr:Endonuclease YhcR precursor [Planctomycetes bacterium SV_7m_r]